MNVEYKKATYNNEAIRNYSGTKISCILLKYNKLNGSRNARKENRKAYKELFINSL
jgi:hypothetical protein